MKPWRGQQVGRERNVGRAQRHRSLGHGAQETMCEMFEGSPGEGQRVEQTATVPHISLTQDADDRRDVKQCARCLRGTDARRSEKKGKLQGWRKPQSSRCPATRMVSLLRSPVGNHDVVHVGGCDGGVYMRPLAWPHADMHHRAAHDMRWPAPRLVHPWPGTPIHPSILQTHPDRPHDVLAADFERIMKSDLPNNAQYCPILPCAQHAHTCHAAMQACSHAAAHLIGPAALP